MLLPDDVSLLLQRRTRASAPRAWQVRGLVRVGRERIASAHAPAAQQAEKHDQDEQAEEQLLLKRRRARHGSGLRHGVCTPDERAHSRTATPLAQAARQGVADRRGGALWSWRPCPSASVRSATVPYSLPSRSRATYVASGRDCADLCAISRAPDVCTLALKHARVYTSPQRWLLMPRNQRC